MFIAEKLPTSSQACCVIAYFIITCDTRLCSACSSAHWLSEGGHGGVSSLCQNELYKIVITAKSIIKHCALPPPIQVISCISLHLVFNLNTELVTFLSQWQLCTFPNHFFLRDLAKNNAAVPLALCSQNHFVLKRNILWTSVQYLLQVKSMSSICVECLREASQSYFSKQYLMLWRW